MLLLNLLKILLMMLVHPTEALALLKISKLRYKKYKCDDPDLERCYELLTRHSRSFATVIILLNNELRDFVCILYLALRALDTIEDQPGLDETLRKSKLKSFHEDLLNPEIDLVPLFKDSPPKEYDLVKELPTLSKLINKMDVRLREVLLENVRNMGAGVAEAIGKGCKSLEEYDDYATYVAGYVGVALNKSFVYTNAASHELLNPQVLSLSIKVGNFLQKTNIIKDFRGDFFEGREFWPRSLVQGYLPPGTYNYGALLDPANSQRAHACLLHMIYNAIELLPFALQYYKLLTHPDVVRFVLVPQAMAISTLAFLSKSNAVFTGTGLKLRQGFSAKLMTLSRPSQFYPIYYKALSEIHSSFVKSASNPFFSVSFEASCACAKALVDLNRLMS